MVVLLRSVGIPARWAKGYNTGSVTKVNGDGTDVYTLSNADAHSWPEVYFPGFGWLPFEPTPGFSNPSSPTKSTTPPTASSQSQQSSSSTSSSRSQASSSQSSTSSSSRTTKAQQTSDISGWWWLVPIVVGITFLWWLQQRWLGLVALFLSKHVTRTNYEQRYRQLLWLLNRQWTRQRVKRCWRTRNAWMRRCNWMGLSAKQRDNMKRVVLAARLSLVSYMKWHVHSMLIRSTIREVMQ